MSEKEPEWLKTAREKGLDVAVKGTNMEALTAGVKPPPPPPGLGRLVPFPDAPVEFGMPKLREFEFQDQIVEFAHLHRWKVAHFRPARVLRDGVETYETPVGGDGRGWPDLVLVRDSVIFAELKVGYNTLSPAQADWYQWLLAAGAAVYVWKPEDWPRIEAILSAPPWGAVP